MSSGSQAVDRQPDRLGLQRDAHDHELLDVGRRDRLDGHAAVGLRVDQALALQHPQRLAQRRAADAELVGERDLRHHGARRDLALEDRLAHAPVDLLDVVAAGEFAPSARSYARGYLPVASSSADDHADRKRREPRTALLRRRCGVPHSKRTVAARLKLLADRLLGPNADAAIIEELVAIKRSGGDPVVPFRVDERVLKPRVAGFIAVGGSLTSQWKTLALPILHTTTFSMHMAVVDQVQFEGAGTPRSIVLDPAAIERAALLGRNVAAQLGRSFEEAEYRGDEPGLCPMCHLDVVVLRGLDVECATCGARGELSADATVRWTDLTKSIVSMDEKRDHFFEIRDTAQRHNAQRDEIESRARVRRLRPLRAAVGPSRTASHELTELLGPDPRRP